MSAAREIAQALGQYASWRAAPYGPLGRSLFAFTEQYDPDRVQDTTLRVSAFGGDPHTYVTTLGDLTALAHLGGPRSRRRILGDRLFPRGTSPPCLSPRRPGGCPMIRQAGSALWRRRSQMRNVSSSACPVRTDRRGPTCLVKLGELLWKKHLAPALRDLAEAGDTAHRQRLLLATTSYRDARSLAEGISDAGVSRRANRPGGPRRDENGSGPRQAARWYELPADRLELFGRER